MDYVELLILSYAVAKSAHELGRMLLDLSVERGHIYVPKNFLQKIEEFTSSMSKMIELKYVKEQEEKDVRNVQGN